MQLYTTKTDVWSLGVMLVELCNRALPYSSLYLTPLQVAIGVADRQLAPALDSAAYPPVLLELITACLQHEPSLRPYFATAVSRLRTAVAAAEQAEAVAAAASQGSLFGRVSGMLQGVASQAQAAAAGTAPPRARPSQDHGAGSRPAGGGGHAGSRQSSHLDAASPAAATTPSPRQPPPPPQPQRSWQTPSFLKTPPLLRPRPVAPQGATSAGGGGTQLPGMGRLPSRQQASSMFQGLMARAGRAAEAATGRGSSGGL